MADFTLAGLRVVQQVAATGSFTRAAEALGYTQSAISRQVAAVEAAAGGPVFDRGRRGAVLTPAGQVLARHAAEILAGVGAAELELAGLRDRLAGRLTIGAFPTATTALVPRAIARLAAGHPGLAVVMQEAPSPALLRRLRTGRLDVAVVATGPGLPDWDLDGLRHIRLPRGGLFVVVSSAHRLAQHTSVTEAELAHERWIVGEGQPGDPQFGAWPTLTDPTIAHAARTWSTRLGLVAAGLGITVIPHLALPSLPATVRPLTVSDSTWPGREALIVTRPDPSPRARAMEQALTTEAKNLASETGL
jgi:DNA-binding transcriptional LysR family regulator